MGSGYITGLVSLNQISDLKWNNYPRRLNNRRLDSEMPLSAGHLHFYMDSGDPIIDINRVLEPWSPGNL